MATYEDIRLIVTDMDGTLLDGQRQLPPNFADVVETFERVGIRWALASGRQLANLQAVANDANIHVDIIAENGALVAPYGSPTRAFQDLTPTAYFKACIEASFLIPNASPILCGADHAWVYDGHPEDFEDIGHFFERVSYWHSLEEVLHHEVCKVAIYHPSSSVPLWNALKTYDTPDCRVIVSSHHWVDIQPARVNKGRGLNALLAYHHLAPEQAIVFGDYLNDLEMMTLGTHAVAMGNAHPDIQAACQYHTLPNTQNGVLHYLAQCFPHLLPFAQ